MNFEYFFLYILRCFVSFSLRCSYFELISNLILRHPCILGINLIWPKSVILLIHCWFPLTTSFRFCFFFFFSFRTFVSMFVSDIGPKSRSLCTTLNELCCFSSLSVLWNTGHNVGIICFFKF